MRKIVITALGCLLALSCTFAGEPTSTSTPAPADQKWLAAVEKMVADGQTKVSTPSKERVNLLQQWANKKGYTVEVTKSDLGYRARLSKSLAKN